MEVASEAKGLLRPPTPLPLGTKVGGEALDRLHHPDAWGLPTKPLQTIRCAADVVREGAACVPTPR